MTPKKEKEQEQDINYRYNMIFVFKKKTLYKSIKKNFSEGRGWGRTFIFFTPPEKLKKKKKTPCNSTNPISQVVYKRKEV